MKIRLFRNAALKIEVAGRTLLVDPDLGAKHSRPSFTGRSPNPMVDLPASVDDILDGVELLIVSHLHADHFDTVAQAVIPKDLPLICQPGDEDKIRGFGFKDVTPLTSELTWNGIRLTRRDGSHGLGPVVEKMGQVIGFSLEAAGEPSLYWAGDTVLYPPVVETIARTRPDIIVTHSCGARWDGELIVMDDSQTVEVARSAPQAKVIAVHMEALDHATVDRATLRRTADAAGIGPERLLVPADGETVRVDKG
ncbi:MULTISPECIES: MBL fold metallo-hydrolase [Phyllobacteriaceae]|jgi:L-ascorbate metabolism protein UlaG (beta-lactamase superfamily)|uniref:Zn-dependent hydrolase n=1 Tax=Mesorhizobium hungaricum TaxID=1566387 RepID=A0A1C2DVB6_9HYPH|nr:MULTISPECIES: MBL fold metallo-hydrolase [Mesorhizobium]MBN9234112.1 MBL fold metallo-hydrolase [Mesorhizobium sp.]MDQ0331648.1 L-ascorbate metabolism protein UlaG (beta-lactamase superfamily) [Mesorhizobium sp. YL-MeA3-2017]OCX18738.1 Zn-dependent hydrolase [Mesorhizobium hungaricum]